MGRKLQEPSPGLEAPECHLWSSPSHLISRAAAWSRHSSHRAIPSQCTPGPRQLHCLSPWLPEACSRSRFYLACQGGPELLAPRALLSFTLILAAAPTKVWYVPRLPVEYAHFSSRPQISLPLGLLRAWACLNYNSNQPANSYKDFLWPMLIPYRTPGPSEAHQDSLQPTNALAPAPAGLPKVPCTCHLQRASSYTSPLLQDWERLLFHLIHRNKQGKTTKWVDRKTCSK